MSNCEILKINEKGLARSFIDNKQVINYDIAINLYSHSKGCESFIGRENPLQGAP
jgi:hypothetical protein